MFLGNRSVLIVSGEGSVDVLQAMLTQNITIMPLASAVYCCLLTPQGKFVLDCFVYRIADSVFALDLHKVFVPIMLKKLGFYKVNLTYEVEELHNTLVYAGTSAMYGEKYRFLDPRSNLLPNRYYVSAPITPIDQSIEYADLLILNGIVDGSLLPTEKVFPLLYGLKEQNAFCITKGCYLGQESVMIGFTSSTINKVIMRGALQVAQDGSYQNWVALRRFPGSSSSHVHNSEGVSVPVIAPIFAKTSNGMHCLLRVEKDTPEGTIFMY